MVEFALGLPVLLALLIGLLEMGRMVMSFTLVGHAAREGARYGAMTTVIAPPPLPGPTPPSGTDPLQPTWWQPCNRGLDDSISPGYVEYPATDSRCVGWPNIVSTAAYGGTGTNLSDMRVRISYDRSPPPIGPYGLEGIDNRGVPLKVTVIYNHRPLFAQFLRIPATVPIQITATTLTQ
jgi:hypothetical protein